jgi:hypothetical protein
VAEDLWQYAMMNGGWISYWRYLKCKSFEPEEAEVPDSSQEIIDAIVYLQEQGKGIFWCNEVGEVDGVYVGDGHAGRAREHRDRALRTWLTEQPSDMDNIPF